ncbi:MAG: serine O-acetyltransferase [Gammaproteobacteria bacterium]|nr:serine O-acetyltransferase [Gammaproteobacteria bacterium]MCB1924500.1 serine O-acetyltransferase [Gammaproteobacteria bacterium]
MIARLNGFSRLPKTRHTLWRQWREDVDCVFDRDPAARTRWEVITTYPGVHAVLCHRLANRLWHRGWRYVARLVAYVARVWTAVDIHPAATIGSRLFIDHGTGVVIGETAEIGDDVTLYHGVTLGGTSWKRGKRHPTVGNACVIGAGAKILGPVVLGSSVKVGANSVVIKDVADGRTAVGIPAKVVAQSVVALHPHGIDLDHHLIPDPVATAIACLLERIEVLEARQALQGAAVSDDGDCPTCDAQDVCHTDHDRVGRVAATA